MAALSCPVLPRGCELVYAFPHFILSPMSQGLSLHLTGEDPRSPSPWFREKCFQVTQLRHGVVNTGPEGPSGFKNQAYGCVQTNGALSSTEKQ